MEWENATNKCQSLGARLPVLDSKETIDIVKKYINEADPEELRALEEWDQSSRRVSRISTNLPATSPPPRHHMGANGPRP